MTSKDPSAKSLKTILLLLSKDNLPTSTLFADMLTQITMLTEEQFPNFHTLVETLKTNESKSQQLQKWTIFNPLTAKPHELQVTLVSDGKRGTNFSLSLYKAQKQ
ncbi:MAG: hypothetical protein ACHQUC_00610 [Chlamydiales bacterium]